MLEVVGDLTTVTLAPYDISLRDAFVNCPLMIYFLF